MVTKSRQQELKALYIGAPYGKGIDHDKYTTIGLLLLVLVAFGWYRGYLAFVNTQEMSRLPVVAEPISTTISINKAKRPELSLLPGVGPKLAQEIIDFRLAHGPIRTWEELDRVKGIGPKTIENIKRYATLD
jgi:competence ComEA-like helix-hairpin-helix protein